VRKVLESISDVIVHVGDVSCTNIVFERMVLEAKAGIDMRMLREIIRNSTGSNYHVQITLPIIFGGNFEPGFRVNLAIKDIGLALEMAKECSVPTLIGAVVEQRLLEAKASGLGDKGTQSLILPLERLAGVEVRAPQT
jgi:3-hydroxyisobutyrate dehydrogenase-like beta-hydroxyacid dehydrogenase